MTTDEAVSFLSSLVNYEQQTPTARDLTLDPIRRLLAQLGQPQEKLPIVHIAGTKGKGSVAAMLEQVLRSAGVRTGLYTSPQLTCLEERVRIVGVPIAVPVIMDLLARIKSALAEMRSRSVGRDPTFFDVMTALALLGFAEQQVQLALLEVGMGGRADSTNVCDPRLAIITSISFDHTKQLGNTLTAIAGEKAGILKPGVDCLSGVLAPEAQEVVRATAQERGAPLRQLGTDFTYEYRGGPAPNVRVHTETRTWPWMPLHLLGEHQAANAALVVAAVESLRAQGWTIPDAAVADGLAQVHWPARIEVVRRRPLVILDCAHNPASAEALLQTLSTTFPEHLGPHRSCGQTWLLFGASRDKDLEGILRILAPAFDRFVLTQYTTSPRRASREALATALAACRPGLDAPFFADPMEAWRAVLAEAKEADLVCVAGSLFLAGELRGPILRGE